MWETGMTYHQTNVVMSMTQSIEGLSKAFLSFFPFFFYYYYLSFFLCRTLSSSSLKREKESPHNSLSPLPDKTASANNA